MVFRTESKPRFTHCGTLDKLLKLSGSDPVTFSVKWNCKVMPSLLMVTHATQLYGRTVAIHLAEGNGHKVLGMIHLLYR